MTFSSKNPRCHAHFALCFIIKWTLVEPNVAIKEARHDGYIIATSGMRFWQSEAGNNSQISLADGQ